MSKKISIATITIAFFCIYFANACSFSQFDDFADKASAVKIIQGDPLKSPTFGDKILGIDQNGKQGALLFVVSNPAEDSTSPSPTFDQTTFSIGEEPSNDQMDEKDYSDLDNPESVKSLALAPNPNDKRLGESFPGPFVYIGYTRVDEGFVEIMDITVFNHPSNIIVAPVGIYDFGSAVIAANLLAHDSREQDFPEDLAIGAKGSVFLCAPLNENSNFPTWPYGCNPSNSSAIRIEVGLMKDGKAVKGSANDGPVTLLAAGDLDLSTPEDEIVAAIPSKDTVNIIYKIKECWRGASPPCAETAIVEIKPKSWHQISSFGSSLLIADVLNKQNGTKQLIVGAETSRALAGEVFIFDLENFFKNPTDLELLDPTVIKAPSNAKYFGASLAYTGFPIESSSDLQYRLAVGAPHSTANNISQAGAIYLYDAESLNKQEDPREITLVNAEQDSFFGRNLTTLPFTISESGTRNTYNLLTASANNSVYVFFSGLIEGHADKRQQKK